MRKDLVLEQIVNTSSVFTITQLCDFIKSVTHCRPQFLLLFFLFCYKIFHHWNVSSKPCLLILCSSPPPPGGATATLVSMQSLKTGTRWFPRSFLIFNSGLEFLKRHWWLVWCRDFAFFETEFWNCFEHEKVHKADKLSVF